WDTPRPRLLTVRERSLADTLRHIASVPLLREVKHPAGTSFGSMGGPCATPRLHSGGGGSSSGGGGGNGAAARPLVPARSAEDLFRSLNTAGACQGGGDGGGGGGGGLMAATYPVRQSGKGPGGGRRGAVDQQLGGIDIHSAFYAAPAARFVTTYNERHAVPLTLGSSPGGGGSGGGPIKGPGTGGGGGIRASDAAMAAAGRNARIAAKAAKLREHTERVALSVAVDMAKQRLRGEQRVYGKQRTRLRYLAWVVNQDAWAANEVPQLKDFEKRQFPATRDRIWGGGGAAAALAG
ncbi:unnamed protein product, partial [Phaeothamnion confervicola]